MLAVPGWYIKRTGPKGLRAFNCKKPGFLAQRTQLLSPQQIDAIAFQIDRRCRTVAITAYQADSVKKGCRAEHRRIFASLGNRLNHAKACGCRRMSLGPRNGDQLKADMLDGGTVVADKQHQQPGRIIAIVETSGAASGVRPYPLGGSAAPQHKHISRPCCFSLCSCYGG